MIYGSYNDDNNYNTSNDIIVMMTRIKMIEENGMRRRGVYFKWRSSQKFCKVDGFKRQNQSYTQERRFEQRSFKKCLPGTQQWERD